MKKIKYIGLLAIAGCLSLTAQTNAPSPGFFSQMETWVGTRDTNMFTFSGNRGAAWTGADAIRGVTVANALGIEYKFGTNSPWAVESVTRNGGIAGTIVGQEGNVQYSVIHDHDLQLSVLVGGGYTFANAALVKGAYGDVKAKIEKALGQNTFGGGYIEEQLNGKEPGAPIVGAFAGFTF